MAVAVSVFRNPAARPSAMLPSRELPSGIASARIPSRCSSFAPARVKGVSARSSFLK